MIYLKARLVRVALLAEVKFCISQSDIGSIIFLDAFVVFVDDSSNLSQKIPPYHKSMEDFLYLRSKLYEI